MSGTLDYRFVIADPSAGVPFVPGQLSPAAAHFLVTSLRGHARPYIESPPRIDGQEVDLVTGKVTDGVARIRVLDLEGTTGGGTPINDELGPTWPSQWAANYAGVFPGNPWIPGFVDLPPYTPSSGSGAVVGGIQTVPTGDQSQWLSRTFTAADGVLPSTTYNIQVRYNHFGTVIYLPWFGAQPHSPVPFVEVNGVRVHGTQRVGMAGPPGVMSVVATSDAAGNLMVWLGYDQLRGYVSFSIGFDWVHIQPGNPAVTGRYSTINLADANARQQFLGRQAYIEASYDRGTSWPHCLHSGYITDIQLPLSLVYEYGVGDTRRTERITKAFVKPTTNFDNTTMFVGGPTRHGWLPLLPYFGFPKFEIEHVTEAVWTGGNVMTSPGEVILKYTSGPMPDAYKLSGDNFTRSNFDLLNERARAFWVAHADAAGVLNAGVCPVNGQRYSAGSFPQLKVEIVDINGDFNPGPDGVADIYQPMSWIASPPPMFVNRVVWDLARTRPWPDTLFGEGGRLRIPWTYNPLYVPPPNVGGIVELGISTRDISQDAPLHIAMHPVDIVRFIYADYGIAFDTTSYQATKDALGSGLRCYMRVTAAENIQSFIEKLFGVFGFSTRVEGGERVFFVLRRKSSTPPTVIVDASVLREEGGPTFELSESTKCNQVRLVGQRFLLNTRDAIEDRAWDDIAAKEQTVVADLVDSWNGRGSAGVYHPNGYVEPSLDAATFGERPVEFSIPGQIYIDGVGELPFLPFARGLAEHIFDRAGRGMQETVLVTRRGAGADDLQGGDEVAVDIPHHPNAQLGRSPSSQRGGMRTATVIRKEEQPEGVIYRVTDAGTGTVPAGISPIAGDFLFGLDPLDSSIVLFDIAPTGATRHFPTDLIAANARIEIQVAFQVGAPTTDGITYTVLDPAEYAYEPSISALIGDYKIRLGPFKTTTAMWARIRTFVPGTTPSAWTTWQTIGTGLPPGSGDISALVVGVITDTTIALSWTNTDGLNPVTVYYSVSGVNNFVLADSLLPGSIQYTLTGLTPSTAYDIRVILAATGTTLSTTQTTTNVGLQTLPAPINAIAFSGSSPNVPPGTGTGIFGMRAQALAVPSVMIFEYATETAVGSGIPGTYAEWTREPSVSGGYTVSQVLSVPNDGRLRYVKAKLRATGWNDSPYTSPIAIDPWLPGQIIPGNPIISPGNPIIIPPGNVSPVPPGTIPTPVIPPPGSSPFRALAQLIAIGIASGAQGTGTIQTGRSSIAYRIRSNAKPCRVRLYRTAAHRTADAARTIDTDMVSGTGCILDDVLTATNGYDITYDPSKILGSAQQPASGTDLLYYSIHNLSAGTEDILVEIDLEVLAT